MRRAAPGLYNTPVAIEAAAETADALGNLKPAWTSLGTVWCQRRLLTGRESVNANEEKATADFALETWHPRDLMTVTPQMRAVLGGTAYGISYAEDPDGKYERLVIYCTKPAQPAEGP